MRATTVVSAVFVLLTGCGAAPYDVGFRLSGVFHDNVGTLILDSESVPAIGPLTVPPWSPGHLLLAIVATAERDLASPSRGRAARCSGLTGAARAG